MQTPAPSAVTKASELAKVQVRVQDENSKRHWLRIAQLAGLTEPYSEGEMAKMTDLVDTRKKTNYENEKRRKIKVDELGKLVLLTLSDLPGFSLRSCYM